MNLEPFNQNDPTERMADEFRKDIAEVASRAFSNKEHGRLSSVEQLQSFMAGALVGVIGVCFAHIKDGGRDAMMEAIEDYLPQARAQAEAIIESAALQ